MKVTSSKAVVLIDGKQIGTCCDLQALPVVKCEPAFKPMAWLASGTVSIRWSVKGKKARKTVRQFRDLALGKAALRYVRHYRAVKHHQLRKRLIAKRA